MLDDGRLTDAKGRVINFRNSIIILTSNVGSEYIDRMKSIGFSAGGAAEEYNDAKEKVMSSLKDHFRPEFLNRLDEIIMFDILSPESVRKIVDVQMELVKKRLAEKLITLIVSDEALTHLGVKGYNPQYGARPLKRLIQDKILTPVANLMVSHGIGEGGSRRVRER